MKPNETPATKPFFDVFELAARWHQTPETIRRKIRRGELIATRIGRQLLISTAEVQRTESAGVCQ